MRLWPIVLVIAAMPLAAPAAPLQVVELYQSQGCSSCPPANAVLAQIANRPDVLALNFSVTYWDRLGWKDSFAQPIFTRRQWDYARAGSRSNVSTPQMIVNGRGVLVGSNRGQTDAAIRNFARAAPEPAITANRGSIVVGRASGARPATVWLVRYDPRSLDVPIRAGENGGKTLPHRDIVRELVPLGGWHGAVARFALPVSRDPVWKTAILVQQGAGGPIVAAAKLG